LEFKKIYKFNHLPIHKIKNIIGQNLRKYQRKNATPVNLYQPRHRTSIRAANFNNVWDFPCFK